MDNSEKITEMIAKSGHSFNYKVVNFLKKDGWTVRVSPYYTDNVTDKPREIDIIAEKPFNVLRRFSRKQIGTVNIKLFIECKYILKPAVFWFDNKDILKTKNLIGDISGLKPYPSGSDPIPHHYYHSEEVAKLFTSGADKSPDNEIIYKAINQSLNALIYFRGDASIIPEGKPGNIRILKTVNYPLILCNDFGNFYKVQDTDKGTYENIKDKFQLEINYAYVDSKKNSQTDYFLIDVVDYGQFSGFLKGIVDEDVEAIIETLIDKDEVEPNAGSQRRISY